MSEERISASRRWLLGALIFSALFWTLDLAVLRAGVPHPMDDTWDDAVVARELLAGGGMRSLTIYPPLWSLRDPATQTVPLLVHGPLLPLILTVPLKLAGPGVIDHMAWLAALLALLAVVPLHRVASRSFNPQVATAGAGLFTVSPLMLEAVHHAHSVVLGALLLAWVLDLIVRERPRAGLAGIVAGIGYLVRPEFLVAVPVLAGLVATGGESGVARTRRAGFFLLGFVACAAGWWWHHWRAVGSPFFNLTSYNLIGFREAIPEASAMRDFALTPAAWPAALRAALPDLPAKWADSLPRAIAHLLGSPSSTTGWLAAVGLVAAVAGAATRRVAAFATLLVLIPVAMMTLGGPERLYLVTMLPLCATAAALGARVLFDRLPVWAGRPRAWIGALALLMLPASGVALRDAATEARLLERWLARDRAGLARLRLGPDAARRPAFSDTPDFVAWETGRPTIPLTREEFDRLYPAAGPPAVFRPDDLPASPGATDVWFHANPRDPSMNVAPLH